MNEFRRFKRSSQIESAGCRNRRLPRRARIDSSATSVSSRHHHPTIEPRCPGFRARAVQGWWRSSECGWPARSTARTSHSAATWPSPRKPRMSGTRWGPGCWLCSCLWCVALPFSR